MSDFSIFQRSDVTVLYTYCIFLACNSALATHRITKLSIESSLSQRLLVVRFINILGSSEDVQSVEGRHVVEEGVPERLGQRYPLRRLVRQHLLDEVEQLTVVLHVHHSVGLLV